MARIRTLLALERNYLAEERTQLAQFRTGLTLTLIVPPLFIFFLEIKIPFYLVLPFYTFFVIICLWGVWIVIRARSKLSKIRKKKNFLKEREKQIILSSKPISELFNGCMYFNEE
ncbi:unnamed protein product [marine sediment metagenome]|uniref:Uncharacterized protein n=1 Tax=marine sediment metagenome TaxID=412755 RepID=X1D1Z5_9ZZZZ